MATWIAAMPCTDRYRLGSREICLGVCAEETDELPVQLQTCWDAATIFIAASHGWKTSLFGAAEVPPGARGQMDALAQAFGGK
jgi:hypothetical protein